MNNNQEIDELENKEKPYKINSIIDEILSKKILLKLKDNLSLYIDGRIIRFSETIKLKSCIYNFDYKLSFMNIDRQIISIIIEFFEVVNWKINPSTFKIRFSELDNWYQYNKKYINEVKVLSNFLKIHVIPEFIDYYIEKEEKIVRDDNIFKTLIDVPQQNQVSRKDNKEIGKSEISSYPKEFEKAFPFELAVDEMYFKIPIEISHVKLNANKNSYKSKFSLIQEDKELDLLIDSMICDAFWFIVLSFQIYKELNRRNNQNQNKEKEENIIDLNKNEELLHKKTLSDILLRISKNYFNFFIKLCEMNKSLKISNKNNMSNTIASSDKVSSKF